MRLTACWSAGLRFLAPMIPQAGWYATRNGGCADGRGPDPVAEDVAGIQVRVNARVGIAPHHPAVGGPLRAKGGWAAVVTALLAATAVTAAGFAHADRDADRDALWHLVHGQCVPNQLRDADPAPCAAVDLTAGEQRGYVVLKDTDGFEQFLVIPTARVTGIEDPVLRGPSTPNYFEYAWWAKAFTESAVGGSLPRDWISLAVNSIGARTQDQLHIHIDCLRADVHQSIADAAGGIGPVWQPLPVPLAGDRYEALTVTDLAAVNPFALAAAGVPDPGAMTVVVVGSGTDADPRFILLRRWVASAWADPPDGEELQDHQACPAPVAPGPFTGK